MNWKGIIPKFMVCKRPAVVISIIFQLIVMGGLVTVLFLASHSDLKDKTEQTFITIYTFICVLLCYVQFNTSIIPEDSKDLEDLIVLVLFQVSRFYPIK